MKLLRNLALFLLAFLVGAAVSFFSAKQLVMSAQKPILQDSLSKSLSDVLSNPVFSKLQIVFSGDVLQINAPVKEITIIGSGKSIGLKIPDSVNLPTVKTGSKVAGEADVNINNGSVSFIVDHMEVARTQ